MSDRVIEGTNEDGATYTDFISLWPHQKVGKGSKVETLPTHFDGIDELLKTSFEND